MSASCLLGVNLRRGARNLLLLHCQGPTELIPASTPGEGLVGVGQGFTLGDVMKQIEAAVPNASLMLAGPPDMASKNAAQGHSRAMAPIIVKNQKQVAKARGWAYWDQYTAMGGAGSMWAWIQSGLGSRDMFHPTGQGGNLLGRWQYQALLAAYEDHLSKDSP